MIKENIIKATLYLFKAVPIERQGPYLNPIIKDTLPLGFVFAPEVEKAYLSDGDMLYLRNLVKEVYGLSAEKLNASFHKSWKKIKDTPMEQLIIEQLAHYMTTYGKEDPIGYVEEKSAQWGIYGADGKIADLPDIDLTKVFTRDEDYIYIPTEVLDLPDKIDEKKIRLVIIKGYTKDEIKEKLIKLLSTGIALKEETLKHIDVLIEYIDPTEAEIEKIKNKEVKVRAYELLGKVPENPTEFLRYLVYRITGQSLLIKNKALIDDIKKKDGMHSELLVAQYGNKYGLERLAEIFYRFKPIFLAFRGGVNNRKSINRIRKLAKSYHKPMKEDYLNKITSMVKNDECIIPSDFQKYLDNANIFRKIRLAYALNFRTKDVDSILYRIRNGRSYATDFSFENKFKAMVVLDDVMKSIVSDISKKVKGKKIYIPDYMTYTLPATEKMFTGNFPSGSYVTIPKDMILGINWKNVDIANEFDHRIDLDLSMISLDGKMGWDGHYRNDERTILFSGDMTDASGKNGATELFYVKKQSKQSFILNVNYYNYTPDIEVPYKILVATGQPEAFNKNYMVDPNNVLAITNSKINQRQTIIGLVIVTTRETKFYFVETNIGAGITARAGDEFIQHSRKYLMDFYTDAISLNRVLKLAGAEIIDKNATIDKDEDIIDLYPEAIEKDTIINLITE